MQSSKGCVRLCDALKLLQFHKQGICLGGHKLLSLSAAFFQAVASCTWFQRLIHWDGDLLHP